MQWLSEGRINRAFDFYGLTDIYLSPLTITLLVFFFITLLVITMRRIPMILRKAFLRGEPPSFSPLQMKKAKDCTVLTVSDETGKVMEKIREFFRKKKWHLIKILFHFSFFLCLIGGLMVTYTRFTGNLSLTEGQTFEGDVQQFFKITRKPKIFKELPRFKLFIKDISPSYENNVPIELTVNSRMQYNAVESSETLRINEPIKRGSLSILAKNIGISPLFIVRGDDGREIDGAYVSLNVLYGQEDSFRKRDLVKTVYEGTIKKGESAQFDSYSISFEDLRYWVNFIVSREYGRAPLITGFALAAIGLIMRLVFYQKRVMILFEYENNKGLLYINGRSEYFHYSFQSEKDRLIEELKRYLSYENP
jgi:cytochrome c biogenesis protein ResB